MAENTGKKFGKLKIAAIIVALFVVVILALPFIIDANQFRPEIEAKLSNALGRTVKAGNLKLSLLSGSVAVEDLSIADNPAFSHSPFVVAKSLKVGIELKPLIFSKEVRITGISLDNPAITLIRSSSGKWNFSDLGSKPSAAPKQPGNNTSGLSETEVSIKQVKIANGRITFIDGRKKPSNYEDLNIIVRNLSLAASFPFTLTASLPGSGKLKLEGEAGPWNKTDALTTPLSADLAVTHLDLVASGFVEPQSGISGILDFNGAAKSDGKQFQSKGHATIDKLQVIKGGAPASQTVSMDYTTAYNLAGQSGILSNTALKYGKATAHLNGNYERQGDSLVLKMKLRGTNMPVQDLTGLLPAFGVTLPKGASLQGGLLNADLTAEGPLEKMVTAGTADIAGTRLVGFDLSGKMALVAKLAGIKSNQETEIEKFASSMRMSQEGIQVGDLLLKMPALGELSGVGTITSDQTLDFKMLASLKPKGGIAGELARLTKGGTLSIPFFVRGNASDPKFVPDVKNTVGSLLGLSDRGSTEDQTNKGDALRDTLRSLFKKKK